MNFDMDASIDPGDRLFNPDPQISVIQITGNQHCLVIDDVPGQAAANSDRREDFRIPGGW
jgi:hypothetical protein